MAYSIKEITIRCDNSENGRKVIGELWNDITSGKQPLLFDSEHIFLKGISPVSCYSNYESNENGKYDLTIEAVTADFFAEMEKKVKAGEYVKYDETDESGNIGICTQKAWQRVWNDNQNGKITRCFTQDFESTVPKEYTKDGRAHCYLYIAVK